MPSKEVKKLLDSVREAGWRVEENKGHYKCYSPDGNHIVTLAGTPSDRRWLNNARSQFRRAGLEL